MWRYVSSELASVQLELHADRVRGTAAAFRVGQPSCVWENVVCKNNNVARLTNYRLHFLTYQSEILLSKQQKAEEPASVCE